MGKFIDLTGMKFGDWIVLERGRDIIKKGKNRNFKTLTWKCECVCGTIKEVIGSSLKNGSSTNCGCKRRKTCSDLLTIKNKKYNKYDLSSGYGIGYTNKGEKFYFDLEDYDKIKDYCWHINDKGYIKGRDKNNKHISFHRLVMGFPNNMQIDHIDHNKSNNKKSNLRIVTPQQNCYNRTPKTNNTGVYKVKNRWKAKIKDIYLGSYNNIDDAIKARKDAETKYFGEYKYKD